MKKIFIVGASILQLPAILKAKEMGLKVGVADYNLEAIGIKYADAYYNVSTIDEKGIFNSARDFGADGIMTLATDMPMRAVAYTAEKLNLKGISYDAAIKATDKGEMIKAFERNGVEHPWYYIINSKLQLSRCKDKIKYPCICKPTDNAGSRGVMLVEKACDLQKAVEYSSANGRSGAVIIEEYLVGKEVSVEAIVIDRIVHVIQITDKLTTGAPHFVEMGHSQPTTVSNEDVKKIKDLSIRAIQAIGMDNSAAHVEIMLTENGPRLIELGARMGGDCITTHLVPLSTGIDMVRAVIELSIGDKPNLAPKYNKSSAIRFFKGVKGVIKRIDGVDKAKQSNAIKEISFTKKVGDELGEIGSSVDRVGFVISQTESVSEAINECENAVNSIKILTYEK